MQLAWLIPALSALAFVVVAFLGRYLPKRGAFVSILAILAGFVIFWFVLADLLGSGLDHKAYSFNWITVGETNITWGMMVDKLSVVMLGLVTGYFRGIVDDTLSRVIDALLALPIVIIALLALTAI